MEMLRIEGGPPLTGEVFASGAKNAALPLIAAALLLDEPLILENVPRLQDIATTGVLLGHMGAHVTPHDGMTLALDASRVTRCEAPYDLVKTMRASILVLGPLLARRGWADVSLPGGCAIGSRPVDIHLAGLRAMGAEITVEAGTIKARANGLVGTRFTMDSVTVTGTENLMMAATLANGVTVLENAACEPEIADLARCLNAMGAEIEGAGTATIRISGKKRLHGTRHRVLPDRIETGTFLAAAVATRGRVTVAHADPSLLAAESKKLVAAGARVEAGNDWLRADARGRRPAAFSLRTAPYPGFATDMQAQFCVIAALADGVSTIAETVFENRFMHAAELERMGAVVRGEGNALIVSGAPKLTGAPVMATDLRASVSLVIAGVAASGTTDVRRIYHLDRGYERLEEKVAGLGANVRRIPDQALRQSDHSAAAS